jgi:hypothetical protein
MNMDINRRQTLKIMGLGIAWVILHGVKPPPVTGDEAAVGIGFRSLRERWAQEGDDLKREILEAELLWVPTQAQFTIQSDDGHGHPSGKIIAWGDSAGRIHPSITFKAGETFHACRPHMSGRVCL